VKFRRKTEVGSAPASPSLYLKYKCPEDGLHLKCKRAECWATAGRPYRSVVDGHDHEVMWLSQDCCISSADAES